MSTALPFHYGSHNFWQDVMRGLERRGPIMKLARPFNVRVNHSRSDAKYLKCWGSKPGIPCPKVRKRRVRRVRSSAVK